MSGVEAFEGRPWLRLWCRGRVLCAIYASGLGTALNGYVRLPDDSPLLVIGQAHDIVARAERLIPSSVGYDGVQQLIEDIHGGLTYGPDEQGWVGFDTAHAYDNWDAAALTQELIDADDQMALDAAARMQALTADPRLHGWPVSNPRWDRHWTLDQLMDETNRLAEMVSDVDQVLRQVRKILESR